ncbi:orotidine-5'-phosphate decarboxylase [Hydrogenivirga sp. 128-5-R1-1]|uniref:orotidine-5'-phosphate decarboxylase n=1 Tax=Hydrogenivirga sp. 128-5-R1-1 TaxID=392423 RepID=UPI00015EF9C7|nr:orotidine-5'-phosphate decarboxylase [Hydrogenivirga sp. 128-5-R1-1]EDP75131.1 orotidine-5'-phosphate decarboxylase [Hydrogenivirga sp. 128-5-R1-1]
MPKLCVALDVDREEAYRLIETLSGYPLVFKVGPKLFLQSGSEVVEKVKSTGCELFLDMKFHDIPNTVRLAVEEASRLGVDYLTLHTLGGAEMLREAVSSKGKVKLIGVTLLTSHDESYLKFLHTRFVSVEELVLYLARTGKEAGLEGVVCSAGEVRRIKEETGLFTVVPGIRLSGNAEDQRRVFTPEEAVREGADMIVMGRDIYRSDDPVGVVEKVLESIGA